MKIKTLLALGLMAGMLFSFADQPRVTKPDGARPPVEQRPDARRPRMDRDRAPRGNREWGPRSERDRAPRFERGRGPKPLVLVLKPETTDADVAAFKAALLKQIDDAVAAGRQNKGAEGRPSVRLAFFVNEGRREAPEGMGRRPMERREAPEGRDRGPMEWREAPEGRDCGPMERRGDRPRGDEDRGLPPPPPPAE